MAIPTAVNGQITDAVTQAGVQTVGSAAGVALGAMYQSMAHAHAITALNAVNAQQQTYMTHQAATTRCVLALLAGKAE